MRDLLPLNYEYMFSFAADCDPDFELHVPDMHGVRLNGYIVGGKVWGPKVNGVLKPVGADWSTANPDGHQHVDVRTSIVTDDGEVIYLPYTGIVNLGGEEGFNGFATKNFPLRSLIMTHFDMETSSEKYDWVNHCACFGIGCSDWTTDPVIVQYDVYRFVDEKKED